MKKLLFPLLIPLMAGAQVPLPNRLEHVVKADNNTAGSFLMLQRNYFGGSRPPDSYFQGFGIQTITAVYQTEFGCPPFVQATVKATAAAHAGDGNKYLFLNDECVDITGLDAAVIGTSTTTANMNDMKQLYTWYKAATSQTVGLYSYVPELIDIHWSGPSGYDPAAYQTINNVLQPLADAVDYLAPSVYCTFTDTATMAWKIRTMVGEAVRLARGKPVYPFISPQYYKSDKTLVPYSYWKMVLNTVRAAGASGAILFVWQPIPWDSTAGWWTAMKEFMASSPPAHPPSSPSGSFSASPATLATGELVTLAWTDSNATSASINNGVGSVSTKGGKMSVMVDTSVTFILTLTNSAGNRTYKAPVTVLPPVPSLPSGSLSASPATLVTGGLVTLTWTDSNATSASINNGVGPASIKGGKMSVTVDTSVTFILTLTNSAGSRIYKAPVTVLSPAKGAAPGRRPVEYSLRQNYPNPFNPSTTIRYEIPWASHVTITVYDMLGQAVSVLVNDRREAGAYEVRFDGSNLASGSYFYLIQAGSFMETKRLLLVR